MAANKKSKNSRKKNGTESYIVPVIAIVIVVAVIAAVCISAAVSAGKYKKTVNDGNTPENDSVVQPLEKDESYAPPEFNISHYAEIDIKDYGKITIGLDASAAPETVENFVSLANSGFYDGLTFHRIKEGFMMQGGDPDGNGNGGSENKIKGEFSLNGVDNPLSHVRGAVSMARAKDYDSARSQFFIVHEDSTFLDGQYAAFGYVIEGIEVVDAICSAAKPLDSSYIIAASEQPVINSITVWEAE